MSLTRMEWDARKRKRVKAPPVGLDGRPVPVFGSNEFDQARELILPGDNWLSIYWFNGNLYVRVYGYYFTHAAECISQTALVEALAGGVTATDNERYLNSTVVVTRWKGSSYQQGQALANYSKQFIGWDYDMRGLSWLLGRGLLYVAAPPLVLAGKLKLAVLARGLAALMNKGNPLDHKQKTICSRVLSMAARKANEAGLQPELPVDKMGAGPGCIAPAHFANPKLFDWVLIKTGVKAPAR